MRKFDPFDSVKAFALTILLLCVGTAALVGVPGYYFGQQYANSEYEAGYKAGVIGAPPEACPHLHDDHSRRFWMKGWVAGFEDRPRPTPTP